MFVQDNAFYFFKILSEQPSWLQTGLSMSPRGYSDLSRLKAVIVSIQSRHIIQFEFILETTCTVPVSFTYLLWKILRFFSDFYKNIMFSINSHA